MTKQFVMYDTEAGQYEGVPTQPAGGALDVLKAKGTATASVANTTADVTWVEDIAATAMEVDGDDAFQINILADGVYLFDVTVRTDSGHRTELFIHTEIDTGEGFAEDTDEIVSDYVSRDADQDTGAVTLSTALSLSNGDAVKFVAEGDCDGTCVLLTAGTILRVVKT